MSKVYDSALSALKDVSDGSVLLVGGFGLCGIPENAVTALRKLKVQNLTCISNNAGVDDFGLGLLLETGQIRKMIASYVGENKIFEERFLKGQIEVEFVPQGTLAERIRCGGAGVPAFYTPTGAGTPVAEGKETREFNGRPHLLEKALGGDFALVKAYKGDSFGNLIYRKTARNFNPLMAMAGRITVAEVEELVKPGDLDPDSVHTPGVFVQRIFQGTGYEKRIEQKTLRERK